MSFTGANVAQLNGLYKEVYGEIINAVPETGVLLEMVPFSSGNKIGDSFHEPVILTNEHGYAYGGTAGDAFDLEDPVSMTMKDAVISAYSYCMSSALSLTAATRAANAGKQSFASAVTTLLENSFESSGKRLEISCIHGLTGIGDVPDQTGFTKDSSTQATLPFSAATWAPGIWCGAEGAKLHFYDIDDGTTLISTGSDAVFTVAGVNNTNRHVVVTGSSTGITALETAVNGGGVRAFFKGSKTNDMAGIKTIFQNTGSLFGIDASAFGLWRGNVFDAAGQLTMSKVLGFVGDLVGRGLKGDITLMVNPLTWADLENEQSALRVYDSSYKANRSESGISEIVYHGQNGLINVVSNPVVMGGEAYLFEPKNLRRVGSAENDKNVPTQDSNPFYALASQAGFGFRYFTDQSIYSRKPARTGYISGIVNTAAA